MNYVKPSSALLTALGLAANSNPNQVAEKLRQLIATAQSGVDNGVKTQIVSYVGTGNYGRSNASSITFSFTPDFVLYCGYHLINTNGNFWYGLGDTNGSYTLTPCVESTSFVVNHGFRNGNAINSFGKISENGKTISWYNTTDYSAQLNSPNTTYYFFGVKCGL